MTIPKLQAFLLPALSAACADLSPSPHPAGIRIARSLSLTAGDLRETEPGRKTLLYETRIRKAYAHLEAAGLVKRASAGSYRPTGLGRKIMGLGIDSIDFAFLRHMPSYREKGPLIREPGPEGAEGYPPQTDSPGYPGGTTDSGGPGAARDASAPEPDSGEDTGSSAYLAGKLEAEFRERERCTLELLADSIRRLGDKGLAKLASALVAASRDQQCQDLGAYGGRLYGLFEDEAPGEEDLYVFVKAFGRGPALPGDVETLEKQMDINSVKRGVLFSAAPLTFAAREAAAARKGKITAMGGEDIALMMYRFGIGVKLVLQGELKVVDGAFFAEAAGEAHR
ncbi:MAG: hypothetical protein LBQ12_05235 [Deltaproteobacteria bacterium]|jgi:restriction endonuclease Mrr|nr:hypothetical protein [Deltaproteobacteria bacterium]